MIPKRSIDTKSFYLDKELEKPVYCLDYINKNNYKAAIITEGPFDCLTGWEYGFPTCATWGQPSPYQIEQLNKSSINVLYLAFDNDEAGQRFSRQIKRSLDKRILIKEVQLPPGRKDINECSKEEFVACMQKAINSNGSISYNIKNTAAGQLHDKLKKYNLKKEILKNG